MSKHDDYWLKQRVGALREILKMDFNYRYLGSLIGRTKTTVENWVSRRHLPLAFGIEEVENVQRLARALEWTDKELFAELGYDMEDENVPVDIQTLCNRLAQLPDDVKPDAKRSVDLILKMYEKHGTAPHTSTEPLDD